MSGDSTPFAAVTDTLLFFIMLFLSSFLSDSDVASAVMIEYPNSEL
jgi:hypothetical protein